MRLSVYMPLAFVYVPIAIGVGILTLCMYVCYFKMYTALYPCNFMFA